MGSSQVPTPKPTPQPLPPATTPDPSDMSVDLPDSFSYEGNNLGPLQLSGNTESLHEDADAVVSSLARTSTFLEWNAKYNRTAAPSVTDLFCQNLLALFRTSTDQGFFV